MKTIRFHRVDNTDYGRYHSPWFKMFAEYCKQYFNVEWVNYATHTSQASAKINLSTDVHIFENHPPLSDVDCIIENMETKKYVVLSFTEYFNSYVVHYLKSEYCQKVCLSHFSYHNIYHWLKRDRILHRIDSVSPWFFGLYEDFDIEKYRELRRNTENLNTELFFKGSGMNIYRLAVKELHDRGILNGGIQSMEDYLTTLATTKCALSYYLDLDKYSTPFDHQGEFCYRDMEYMALGVPFIRIEYKDSVYNGLLPNYHYISIPREHAYNAYDKYGNTGVANLLEEKYKSIIKEDDFLNFISNNQKKWFDKYARWPNSAEFTIKVTEMDKWI